MLRGRRAASIAAPSEEARLDPWVEGLARAWDATREGIGLATARATLAPGATLSSSGATLSIHTDDGPVQLAMLGEADALAAFARALMRMDPGAPIHDHDTADAVSEIVNVLAGALKAEVIGRVPSARLGLPAFRDGIRHRAELRRALRVTMGEHVVTLLVEVGEAR